MSGSWSKGTYSVPKYEQDPRWTAVDEYTNSHLIHPAASNASVRQDALEHALETSKEGKLPDIAVSAAQGKFLALQCQLVRAKHVLEVGTLGGYSTIWFANAGPHIKVTTVEVNDEHAAIARKNLEYAGVADRVEVLVGSGTDVLPELVEEVQAGRRSKFEMVFIDADKENNWFYFDSSVKMCERGACVIVDNVVRGGKVADAELAKSDVRISGSREVVERVGKDERVEAVVMQTVGEKNYDGFLMAVVR